MTEWDTGAPGLASCSSTVPLMISASATASAPARVAGAVVPKRGHGQEDDRNARLGQDQGALDALLVLNQRGDGAQHQRKDGAAAQFLPAAGQITVAISTA